MCHDEFCYHFRRYRFRGWNENSKFRKAIDNRQGGICTVHRRKSRNEVHCPIQRLVFLGLVEVAAPLDVFIRVVREHLFHIAGLVHHTIPGRMLGQ